MISQNSKLRRSLSKFSRREVCGNREAFDSDANWEVVTEDDGFNLRKETTPSTRSVWES